MFLGGYGVLNYRIIELWSYGEDAEIRRSGKQG